MSEHEHETKQRRELTAEEVAAYDLAHPGFARIRLLFEYLDPTEQEREQERVVTVETPLGGYSFSRAHLEEKRGEVRDLIATYITGDDAWFTTGKDFFDLQDLPEVSSIFPGPAAADALLGLAIGLGFAKAEAEEGAPLSLAGLLQIPVNVTWNLGNSADKAAA